MSKKPNLDEINARIRQAQYMSTTPGYSDALNKALQETYRYGSLNDQNRLDVANTIVGGGGMTSLNTGDIASFDWDNQKQTELDRVNSTNFFRNLGLFDTKDYATNKGYTHMSSLGYLNSLLPTLQAEIEASQQTDRDMDVLRQQTAETSARWYDLMNADNETEMDRWYNMLMADYLLGDRNELFDFEAIDSRYGEMSDEEYNREYQRLTDQWNNLDWGTLTGGGSTNYQSKTSELQGQYNTVKGEVDRRTEIDALKAGIRGAADYGTLSAYNDTYVAPEKGTLGYIFTNEPFINGYDNQMRFMNSNASWADKTIAAEYSAKVRSYLDKGYDYLTPDELADYNYLINAGRTDDAARYLELLGPELLYRRAMVMKEYQSVKATNPWLAAPTWVEAGVQQIGNVFNLPVQIYETWTGKDNPYSAAWDAYNKSQWTSEAQVGAINDAEIPDWADKALTFLYKGTSGARDNFTRLLASGFNPTGALILAGAQSTSGSLHDSSQRNDMSAAAKIIKAIGTGAIEVGTEKIGLDALFDRGQKGALEYLLGSMGAEIGEETLNAVSEPVLEAVVAFLFDHEAEIMSGEDFWKNLTDTAITTALSSLFMSGGSAIQMDSANQKQGKNLQQNGDIEAVLKIAEELGSNIYDSKGKYTQAESAAQEIREMQKNGKNVGPRHLGRLINAITADMRTQDAQALNSVLEESIEERLVELGEDTSNAKKLAPVIRNVYQGKKLTLADRASLHWTDAASQVVKEMATFDSASETEGAQVPGATEAPEGERVGQRWKTATKGRIAEVAVDAMGRQYRLQQAMTTKKDTAVEQSAQKVQERQKGKPKLKLKEISYIDSQGAKQSGQFEKVVKKDGKFFVAIRDAHNQVVEVETDAIDNAETGLATIIEHAAHGAKHDMSAEEANVLAATYQQKGGDIKAVIRQFEDSYLAGYSGLQQPQGADTLDAIAYEQGAKEAAKDEEQRIEKTMRTHRNEKPRVTWLGDVSADAEVRGQGGEAALEAEYDNLTEGQQMVAEFSRHLAEQTGLNVVLFRSKARDNGEYGTQNGSYDSATHTVYLDVNAGNLTAKDAAKARKEGTLGYAIMRTMGHEVTHAIEATSPTFYAQYREAVKRELMKAGKDWTGLIRAKLDNAVQNGEKLTYGGAVAEVVADASEYMLQDSAFVNNLDTSLRGKVKAVIKDFTAKVKAAFRNLTGGSAEARALRNDLGQYNERLQKLWDAAFVEMQNAGEAYEYPTPIVTDGDSIVDDTEVNWQTGDAPMPTYRQFSEEEENAGAFKSYADEAEAETAELSDVNTQFSLREEAPPKKTGIAYKVFFEKNGKLYPPMVANPGGADTPVGVWLNADVGTAAPPSKTGRLQVKAGGKGTQGGSGSLAFRPGWHLGDIPKATQFNRLNKATGAKELFPYNFVWAECEYAMDVDYQEEAMSYGYNANGKFQHSLAGLPRLPVDGYYHYRTNPDPNTVPWVITGAMKVNKILSRQEVDAILHDKGVEPTKWQGPDGEQMEADGERFNTANADIRYSHRTAEQGTVQKSARDQTVPVKEEEADNGIEIDVETESSYATQYSIRTWSDSDYVTQRDEAAKRLAKTIGVPVPKAKKWIDDVNSIAAYILGNKARLDYIPTAVQGMSAFKSNPEYGGSIDMSTICAKRRLATGTLDAIQRVLGDAVLTKDDFLHIREIMKERGYEVACGLCFVESSRKNLSKYNRQFLDQYRAEHPDVELGMVDLNTVEGLEKLRSNPDTADIYAAYEKFMNKLAQRKPKLFEKRTEYNHEILKKFKSDTSVGVKNTNGGLRLQSFSDFEIVHLLDMMQVITDMASVGLAGQAYTKVPDFAWALGDTGLKINLSLIAKDVDADGNLIFDDVEGMNHKEAKKLRDAYSKNVGTIVVTFTDEQTIAAMQSDFIDYIIPFHRSQWQKGDYKKLGLPEGAKDYTMHQNEKEGRKRVKENFLPNAYWDFSVSGKQNAINYLKMCADAGRTPKFAKFLENNGDGTYSLKADGSTDGYWKLLIDFKMYDNAGNGSPQMPVKPTFNMDQAMRMLKDYNGEHDTFPVAQDVVDDFVKEYTGNKGGVTNAGGRYMVENVQLSRRDAPTEVTTREFLTDADSSIAETIEERNALTIYQKLLKKHATVSEAVIAAEEAMDKANEEDKPVARKMLAAARAEQKNLYNRLLDVERTAHVQAVVKRSQQIVGNLYGKKRSEVDKMVSDLEKKAERLRADLQGLKGAAKVQQEADIRAAERNLAAYKSKAAQALLANSEKYQQQIAAIRLRRDINAEIGKRTRHITRIVKALNDRIVHEEDYKNVKEPLKPVVHKLVQTFIDGFGNMVFSQQTASRLRTVYDELAKDDGAPEFYSNDVADWLSELADMRDLDAIIRAEGSSSLSAAEEKLVAYTRVAEIADHIYKLVTDADEIFLNGRRASFAAISGDVGNALTAKKDRRELAGWAGKLARFADNLIVKGNMMPQFFFEGLNNNGMMSLYDGLQDGVREYSERMLIGEKFMSDVMRRHGYRTWAGMKKPVPFKTKQGHTIYLTRENMMWIYATAKREASNPMMDTHHLDEGGITYEEIPTEKGRQIEGKGVHHLIAAEDVAEITRMLTADQIAYVDECVEFLSTECADWGNEASMQLFGIKKYKEGYYFPFKVDSDQLHKNSAAGATSTVSDARLRHISFSHSIKKGANTPLIMGNFTSVITDHINQMATYSGMVVPVENMNRVLNRKVDDGRELVNIRSLIARKYGDNTARYIDDLLKDLNGGPQTDNRGSLDAGLRLFKRNAVVGKLSVALQQPTAITRAFAYINPRWFANLHLERPKHTWERMMKYSSATFLKDMGGFNVGMGKGASNWLERGDLGDYRVYKRAKFLLDQKSFKDAVDEWNDFLTGLPGFMDKITWCAIWNAAENEQAHQHPSMDRNSDEFLEMVGRRFDGIVNHTQVYDSILSKSQNMRSKNAIAKMATSFMAESTLNMNLAYRAIASKDGKQIAKVTASLILNAILGAAAYALIGAFNKDDDDRTLEEKYATAFAGRLADNLNPLASIPYLSDLWNKLQGYDVERTDLSFLFDLIEDGGKFWSKMTDPEEVLSYRDYENFVGGLISTATGIPAKNWMGDARRIWNMTHTSRADAPFSSVWYGILDEVAPGRDSSKNSYYERYLAALRDGDKQEQYDLKEYLTKTKGTKEEDITEGVRNAYKNEYHRGGIDKQTAIKFLLDNNLVSGDTAEKKKQKAFQFVDKWDEGTEGYSAYNTLTDALAGGNTSSIQTAWKELTSNGYTDKQIKTQVKTLIKELVQEKKITAAQATALLKKWSPYEKDKDNQNKPLEWLKENK